MASAGTAPAQIPASSSFSPGLPPNVIAASRVRSAGNWFYWIAGLSLLNSAVVILGGNFHFVVGMGITAVVDALAKQAGSAGVVLDIMINGFIAGVFCLFGNFAGKGQKWAFLVGMTIYALDAFLLLAVKDVLSVGFHAYALFAIYRGYSVIGQLSIPRPATMTGAAIQPR
jgi:hypothetical protein